MIIVVIIVTIIFATVFVLHSCSRSSENTAVVWSQASQVRKSNYVPEKGMEYDPDKNHTCTVYAGTMIQQVTLHAPCLCTYICTQDMLVGSPIDVSACICSNTRQVCYHIAQLMAGSGVQMQAPACG